MPPLEKSHPYHFPSEGGDSVQPSTSLAADEASSLAAALMGPSMSEAASLIPTATMTAGRARSTAQEARSWRTGGKGGRIKVFTY